MVSTIPASRPAAEGNAAPLLRGSVVVANAKGGVGKTTLTANLAVAAAAGGRDVVAVDLDPQGNLSAELGVAARAGDARSLTAMALRLVAAPLLVNTTRPRLRCLPGGPETLQFARVATAQRGEGGIREVLYEALAPLAADGVALFVDTQSAAGSPLTSAVLAIAEWVLVPTRPDRDSMAGVARLLTQLEGSAARLAGVVMFDVNPRSTAALRGARAVLDETLGGGAPLLAATIRHAEKASREAKALGLVASEYAALRSAVRGNGQRVRVAGNAGLLAADYAALAAELSATMAGEARH